MKCPRYIKLTWDLQRFMASLVINLHENMVRAALSGDTHYTNIFPHIFQKKKNILWQKKKHILLCNCKNEKISRVPPYINFKVMNLCCLKLNTASYLILIYQKLSFCTSGRLLLRTRYILRVNVNLLTLIKNLIINNILIKIHPKFHSQLYNEHFHGIILKC